MWSERAWVGYAFAVGAAAACTAVGLAMRPRFDIVNVAMVYVLAVTLVALHFSRGAAIAAAVLCVLAFDVVFVPPEGVLAVHDAQYLLTFAILLAVALVISRLTHAGRRDAEARAAAALEAETERVRSTLLASISHDLRSPLAVLEGASSTLAESGERLPPDERAALARSIYRQARELSEQVDKVLQMTRLEASAIAPLRDWTAVAEIAEGALRRLAERLAEHRVVVDLAPDLPLVRVDATLLEQALANLLDNAARHTPPGTVIVLRAQSRAGEILVSVEDSGPQLPEGDLERLFAKFQRGAREAPGAGVGLGLAICRAIVRLHGGKAWAERNPGGGIAVRFTLPVEPAPAPPAEAAEP